MTFNFNTSLTGLFASQKGLSVISNNIANMETQGYARQRLELKTSSNMVGSGVAKQIGSGVISQEVIQVKDNFLINKVRQESGTEGMYSVLRGSLTDIEMVFGENETGSMTDMMKKFFNSLEELAKYPEQNANRVSVLSQANDLANRANYISSELNKITREHDTKIETTISNINELTEKIALINKKIGSSTTENPNALYDERDRYIDELSKYVDVKVKTNIDNPRLVDISVGGSNLVSGGKMNELKSMYLAEEDRHVLHVSAVELNLKSGELMGAIKARNEFLPGYKAEINQVMNTLITEMNAIHQTGFGLDNTTGENLFVGTNAHDIAVNPLLLANPEKLAASGLVDTVGNSEIAKQMADLRDSKAMSGGTKSMLDYWGGVVFQMGSDLHATNDQVTFHGNMKKGFEIERQSVQGVNMDEELANMMEFQRFYQANAKMVSMIDKTFDTLFQMM